MDNQEIILKNIDKSETARYMGYKDTLPDVTMTKIILEQEQELLKVMEPRYTYKVFPIQNMTETEVSLCGSELKLTGTSIVKHLKGCEQVVLMCTTLSAGVDKLLRRYELSNMVYALVVDALANAGIEQVCDEVEKILKKEFHEYNMTWRFGVGYGDLPLSLQKEFLATLDAEKRIGVCATDNCLLTPRKSVTCIIGLSKGEVESGKSCDNCNLSETCNLRKNGRTCK